MDDLPFHPAAALEAVEASSYGMDVFRYSLIVVTIEGAPMVLAVAHHGRKPGYWRDRLE